MTNRQAGGWKSCFHGNGKQQQRKAKRQYIWCPVAGCLSGPVQKITKHFHNVHQLSRKMVKDLTLIKRFEPLNTIGNCVPNPHVKGPEVIDSNHPFCVKKWACLKGR